MKNHFLFTDEEDEGRRVRKYSTFIDNLPKINRFTLEALLQHLYRYKHARTHARTHARRYKYMNTLNYTSSNRQT